MNYSFGEGLKFVAEDNSFAVKCNFRFQTLYQGRYFETGDWTESLMIRRSRLKFGGHAFRPNIKYKLELGLSNRDVGSGNIPESGPTANIVLDAVVKWQFAENWQLWVGQTKLPGNRERVFSSQELQFVDRSRVNSRYTLDRDIGIQLHGKHKIGRCAVIEEKLAISTGEGRNIIVNNPYNGRQYTARFEWLPFGSFANDGDYFGADLEREDNVKLSLGITADYNHNTVRSRGNLGSFVREGEEYVASNLNTLFIDALLKYRGFSASGEYAHRSTFDSKNPEFGYGQGIALAAGYLLPSDWELSGRFTEISPANVSSINQASEYLIGISKYVSGHSLKIQSDFSYTTRKLDRDFFMMRVQVEVAL
ncbi:porin [Marinoscillum furvescens]|nr:porin [Marinoscillum furvescens]